MILERLKCKHCKNKICSPGLPLVLAKTITTLAEESTTVGIHLVFHHIHGARVCIREPREIDEVVH